ncbi:MAG TPA: hypothetical protein P5305_22415, partial [Rubrivivax sp.]|nr:hypothetical protein [Rubrivivax sp.]
MKRIKFAAYTNPCRTSAGGTMTSEKLVDAAPLEGVSVHYIVESDKSFHEASFDLEPVVQRHGLAVL